MSNIGLPDGEGEWLLGAFFCYVDRRHDNGKGVSIDNTGIFKEYQLDPEYLISSGEDGVGGQDVTRDHWLAALNVGLKFRWNRVRRLAARIRAGG